MADISGLIVTVLGLSLELASALYSYSKDVKGALREIQQLSNELFALIGVLQHIKLQREHRASGQPNRSSVVDDSESLNRVLTETVEFLHELQNSLAPRKSRFQTAAQKLKWPLQEQETQRHLLRLERVKSYLVLSQVTEEMFRSYPTDSVANLWSHLIEDLLMNVTEWLCPIDPKDIREKVASSRVAGSGKWFANSGDLANWRHSKESSTFWLNGITGAGKTTLMTTVLDQLTSEIADGVIAYFYCSFASAESLISRNILGSILAQLCSFSSRTFDEVSAAYTRIRGSNSMGTSKSRALSESEMVELIIQSLQQHEEAYILLDGINECDEPQYTLNWLSNVTSACTGCSIRLFLSSINEKDIEPAMEALPNVMTETLRQRDIQNDVRSLVLSTLATDPRLRRQTSELKDEIEWALTRGAKGMFRWVHCQLDILSRCRTPGAIREALANLPPTLDKTYEGLLDRIDGEEDRGLAREILQLLCFSFRPLTLSEICELLQTTPGLRALDESKSLADPKDILSICGSLLNYQQYTGYVTVAHHSVKAYLTSNLQGRAVYFGLSEDEAHRVLATKCLTYLSFDAFAGGPCHENSSLRDKCRARLKDKYQQFSFLDYAAQRWTEHVRLLTNLDDTLWTTLKAFLFSQDDGRGNFLAWVQMLLPSASAETIGRTPPLYYAASYGLTTVVQYLLEAGVDTEVHAGRCGATPLNIASFRGHYDVVKLLLEHGANPNTTDDDGLTALQWAVLKGHRKLIELLNNSKLGVLELTAPKAADSVVSPRQHDLNELERKSIGRLVVTMAQIESRWDNRVWWLLVGLAESQSEHSVGESIRQAAMVRLNLGGDTRLDDLDGVVLSFANISGKGIRACVAAGLLDSSPRYHVLIGRLEYLCSEGCSPPESLETDTTFGLAESTTSASQEDCTQAWVAINGSITGVVHLSLFF